MARRSSGGMGAVVVQQPAWWRVANQASARSPACGRGPAVVRVEPVALETIEFGRRPNKRLKLVRDPSGLLPASGRREERRRSGVGPGTGPGDRRAARVEIGY